MAEEVVAAETAVEAAAVSPPVNTDHKRKLEDLEPQEEEAPMEQPVQVSSPKPIDPESQLKPNDDAENSLPDAKRPRLEDEEEEEEGSDGSALENGHEVQKSDETATENALNTIVENAEPEKAHRVVGDLQTENVKDQPAENPQIEEDHTVSAETPQASDVQPSSERNLVHPTAAIPQQVDDSSSEQQPIAGNAEQGDLTQRQSESESQTMSRKMEVPNNKVGVLIGKAGDTIRFLQYNSGAKIQITRDSEADRHSSTRPVELIGSLDNINKAEKLIKDVIAEADAGGSPSLVARGFGTVQTSGATEQIQIQVPNEKVGLIIGKGGETIKNLQTKSCARIQLIPQHLPEGDQSKERTVRVTGDKKQIEVAREMIKEVMNQPVRSSSHSGSYNQHTYRPRGPSGPPQWGPRGPAPNSHDYQQRGMYPSQNPQYMSQNYGGYPPQQPTPRSNNFNPGWEQRPSGPVPTPPQGSGYDYYAQGSHGAEAHGAVPANALPGTGGGGAPTQMNNYYGQPQGQEYGQPTNYPHSAPTQQNYGHGYEDPKYANQVAAHPSYGGHGNAQTGAYQQQVNAQHGYVQQPYSKPPAYGMQSQGPAPQAYGPPRATQPGDVPYQNPTQSYGAAPSQQQYPYASTGPAQQTYPYGPNPVANDGYNQAPSHAGPTTAAYSQQGGQTVAGYGQPAGPPGPGYAQGGQAGGYGPYPSSQQGYTEQSVPNTGGYYQGPADTSYGAAPASAYGVPPNAQTNYVQPTANQPGYEQQVPHSGAYASVPGSAAVGYKNLSPQPVYGQYDANQMYGGHH